MAPPTDFDARAATWDSDPAKVERAHRVAEAITAHVPDLSRRSILEYGCGTGLLGLALQPRVDHVTLADSSEGMLAMARAKVEASELRNVEVVRLDLTRGPLPSMRYDLVCSLLTLHHIPSTDDILGRFAALLREGGILCLSDLDAEDGSFHGAGFDGHNGFDRQELGAKMERAGLSVVGFTTVCDIERQTAAGMRRFTLFLAIAAKRPAT